MKSLHERGIAPPCAPGSEACHAASEEALLETSRAFFAASAAPSTDEESARSDATVQTFESRSSEGVWQVDAPTTASTTESARGQMCRELHEPFLVRISSSRNRKDTQTVAFFLHFLPTGLSTACPPERPLRAGIRGFQRLAGSGARAAGGRSRRIEWHQ